MVKNIFLTDSRRDVLEGNADHLSDDSLINAKSRIRTRARLALDELIEVAASPAIDNESVFEPDEVYTLISILLGGRGGVVHSEGDVSEEWEVEDAPYPKEIREQYDDYKMKAWKPDEDYAQELYVRIDGGLRGFHEDDDDRTPRPRE